jgi:hypothetical protein
LRESANTIGISRYYTACEHYYASRVDLEAAAFAAVLPPLCNDVGQGEMRYVDNIQID